MIPSYKIIAWFKNDRVNNIFQRTFFRGLKWAKIMRNYSHIQWLVYFEVKLASKV